MTSEERLKALSEYIERAKQILLLSSPKLEDIKSDEDFRLHLLEAFQEIGDLGRQNVETLSTYLLPLLDSAEPLSDDDIKTLREFSAMLIDTTSMENLDLPLLFMQAERLLEEAKRDGDLKGLLLAADNMIAAAYMMINLSSRLYPEFDDCFRYRDIGFEAADIILEHLEPDKFRALPDDECREIVLINSRYVRCLFEWDDMDDRTEVNNADICMMQQSLSLAYDDFYRSLMPDYDWDSHVFRTLQYLADFTEYNNKHGFNESQLNQIMDFTNYLLQFVKDHPDYESRCPVNEQELYRLRNTYLSGGIQADEYRRGLLEIMEESDFNDFSARNMFVCITAPMEYILTLDPDNLSEEQMRAVRTIYKRVASYAYHMPKTGVLSFMLTLLSDLLKHYIEVPGGMSFREMCRLLMIAMHPPTYVHSLSIADISVCLASKLIDKRPELFCGIEETSQVSEVLYKKEEILDYIYNGAVMHDIGKLFIMETILTYGRNLLDTEYGFIKGHTIVGASLLRSMPNTAKYADLALGHHLWFDGSNGYPESAKDIPESHKAAVSVVAVADCLDAATDSVGRSYKQGKLIDEVIEELREGSGTRYADYVVDLLDESDVRDEIERLLTEGRDKNYRSTFHALKSL